VKITYGLEYVNLVASFENSVSEMNLDLKNITHRLKTEKVVLGDSKQNQPIILHRHNRWHLIIIGYLSDPANAGYRGIASVNFMNARRAETTLDEWMPYCPLVEYEEVSPDFEKEVQVKILEKAEQYRELLENGKIAIVGGFTTDTLRKLNQNQVDIEISLSVINGMMIAGQMGPFIQFEESACKILLELGKENATGRPI
jgi:hypothetical protein